MDPTPLKPIILSDNHTDLSEIRSYVCKFVRNTFYQTNQIESQFPLHDVAQFYLTNKVFRSPVRQNQSTLKMNKSLYALRARIALKGKVSRNAFTQYFQ